MQVKKKNRKELFEEINAAGRRMSTATLMFHQTVAEKAGIPGIDHKYLDLLIQEGAMTAGRLAELSGLTTGAVTGIIDRLEKHGLVKRENDPHDRRKVLVIPMVDKAMEKTGAIFASLHSDIITFYDKFSDDELEVILRFLRHTSEFFHEKTQQLRKKES